VQARGSFLPLTQKERLLGVAPAQWWRLTGLNFFDRVPKSLILQALEEVGGTTLAARQYWVYSLQHWSR
jgi:hypothetical protein